MSTQGRNGKVIVLELTKCIYIALSFFLLDAVLRYLTRWLGYYSIFELPPSLFSLCWIAIFIVVLSLMPRKVGRIIYAIWYGAWGIYSIAQYVYYLIFDKFFFLSDIRNVKEGSDYFSYILQVINLPFWIMLILFIIVGILGFALFPNYKRISTKVTRGFLRVGLGICACVGMIFIPSLYGNHHAQFLSSDYEYEQFTNSGFDVEIAGLYHYVARDYWRSYLQPEEDNEEQYEKVDTYLHEKDAHLYNQMTGVLKGKNLLLIQLETIDDWMITEETMPVLYSLMQESINFTNMYTCMYGSGYTFATEFAFNTSTYQSTSGIAAYSMSKNSYPYSIANLLKNEGYTCQSFHQNVGTFYSRTSMHPALGYERYVSTADLVSSEYYAYSDLSMVADDTCWNMMTKSEPFLTFINTYGAHFPYNAEDPMVQWAMAEYPEYIIEGRDHELNVIYAKARTLDDMFNELLHRLETDGLIENTVIIAYADHYCYGLSDKEFLQKVSEENGSSILERTPAFIWYEGCESMTVDKVCQTIDWVPTIANLFGIDVTPYVMGNDIFDDAYQGYAIFPNGTWLTNEAYAVNGVIRWNNGMSNEEIENMNLFVQKFYAANEAILASDYYKQFED